MGGEDIQYLSVKLDVEGRFILMVTRLGQVNLIIDSGTVYELSCDLICIKY